MLLDLQIGALAEPVSGRRWDNAAIDREVACRIARLRAHGLARGNRVFLTFGNRLEFFTELLAIWHLGACAVPIDARLTPFEVTTLVNAASPRLAIIDDATHPAVLAALADSGVPAIDTTDTGSTRAIAGLVRLDDDALILFTSGSTGAPQRCRPHPPIATRALDFPARSSGHGRVRTQLVHIAYPFRSRSHLQLPVPVVVGTGSVYCTAVSSGNHHAAG